MGKYFSKISAVLLISLLTLLACSHKGNNNPYEPVAPQKGKVNIINNSDVSIRLLSYKQARGSQQIEVPLSVHIFPGDNIFLRNKLDEGDTQIFPGGDIITIRYMADVADPHNPGEPLFQNTVDLTVNGSLDIQVKSGGDYGISPG
jgi:hypothetical protein